MTNSQDSPTQETSSPSLEELGVEELRRRLSALQDLSNSEGWGLLSEQWDKLLNTKWQEARTTEISGMDDLVVKEGRMQITEGIQMATAQLLLHAAEIEEEIKRRHSQSDLARRMNL